MKVVIIPEGPVALLGEISVHWPPKAILECNDSTQDVCHVKV